MIKKLLVITAVLLILTACYIRTTGGTPAPTPKANLKITVDGVEYKCKSHMISYYTRSPRTKVKLYSCEGYIGKYVVITDYTTIKIEDTRE